ncbi:MAG: hypothetical protein H0U68_20750 [Ramlibacter sp.]|nr:hypothetical protein [Ramlibacter sp.]
MSASQASAATAIAFQLIAALDRYKAEVEQLAALRVDPEAYHRLRLSLDEMRRYAFELPSLSLAWVELLIRHFELVHALWKQQQQGDLGQEAFAALHQNHRDCLETLRVRCLRTLLQQDGTGARA